MVLKCIHLKTRPCVQKFGCKLLNSSELPLPSILFTQHSIGALEQPNRPSFVVQIEALKSRAMARTLPSFRGKGSKKSNLQKRSVFLIKMRSDTFAALVHNSNTNFSGKTGQNCQKFGHVCIFSHSEKASEITMR